MSGKIQNQIQQKVFIEGESEQPSTEGIIQIEEWDSSERVRKAVKVLLLCWGAAVLSVLVPLLHFILVPGLLIAGPIAAYMISSRTRVILGGDGVCPFCKKGLKIARSEYRFPMRDICTDCHREVRIVLTG